MAGSEKDISRRTFVGLAGGAAGVSITNGFLSAEAQSKAPRGANDKVRMALIGTGNRGREVAKLIVENLPDANYVAACDVYKTRLDLGMKMLTEGQKGLKVDSYDDYRRVLDRKDIDAVHIATPDHWHCKIVVDAIAAGKDIYVEKPLSNNIEPMVEALKAYKAADRVIQFGTQQRSATHFQEAAKIVQDGDLGKITHAVLKFPGTGYGTAPEPVVPVPAGLNWDMWQGPAPRHEFKTGRLRWRGWWDYGGGLITDWGVHLTQVVLWYLNAEHQSPLLTAGVSQYVNFVNPEHDQSPDAFVVNWQYGDFVMSFTNAAVHDWEFGRQGNYFFGPKGSLLIHRQGYEVRPPSSANPRPQTQPAPQVVTARRIPWREPGTLAETATMTIAHGRNFLDCIKSRQKPVTDLEAGFYASLPCLLAIKAIRESRSFKWDDTSKNAVAV